MQINLNQLYSFFLAAKNQSITKAAAELFITQPAVTFQLKSLEEALKLQLYTTQRKKFRLTDSGQVLYEYAQRIFEIVDEMEYALREFEGLTRGSITIGITRSFAKKLMPKLLARFQVKFPEIKISLKVGSSSEIVDRVMDYDFDLGIVGKMSYPGKIKHLSFSKEEFCLVIPPTHRFTKMARVSFNDLKNEPFIIREKGSSSRDAILAILKKNGVAPKVFMEAESVEFIKEYIIKGQGISILYAPEVELETKYGMLKQLPLEEGTVFLETEVIFRDEKELSPPAQALLKLIEEEHDVLSTKN